MAMSLDRDDYSVSEAARALGVSPSTVWRWINAKRLPAFRVGTRKIRIRRDDLAAMVAPARMERPAREATIEPIYRVEWTPEEQIRQKKLLAEILDAQKGWSIAPRTTADLIREVREEREDRYASWSAPRRRRIGRRQVAPSR
ncbi:MAG: helix-turn-helix domain-containing protein [Thermomicrobiales bacterium]